MHSDVPSGPDGANLSRRRHGSLPTGGGSRSQQCSVVSRKDEAPRPRSRFTLVTFTPCTGQAHLGIEKNSSARRNDSRVTGNRTKPDVIEGRVHKQLCRCQRLGSHRVLDIFRPIPSDLPGYSIPLFGQLSTRDAGDTPHGGLDVEQIVNDVHSRLNATTVSRSSGQPESTMCGRRSCAAGGPPAAGGWRSAAGVMRWAVSSSARGACSWT